MKGKMSKTPLVVAAAVAQLLALEPTRAGLLSKTYEFRAGVILEIGASTADGLRLDTVRFQLPSETAVRTASEATVTVTLSNTSDSTQRVGIGVALFDEAGRMVGVATGGTKIMGIKPGSQKVYKLIFDDVYIEAPRATTFQISVETKP